MGGVDCGLFAHLELPAGQWTRWLALVAANDRGHIAGTLPFGASREEIASIRVADRSAQRITPAEEEAGRAAPRLVRRAHGGRLLVVTLPHNAQRRSSIRRLHPVITPRLTFFVLTPASVNSFGSGEGVAARDATFPGSKLPQRGFWGFVTARPPRRRP